MLGLLPVAVTVEAPKFGVILVEIGAAVGAEKAGLDVHQFIQRMMTASRASRISHRSNV